MIWQCGADVQRACALLLERVDWAAARFWYGPAG
jgi:hypothetical protein